MKFAILKAIIGFMNANEGTLIIGVNDDHQILGLELDYKSNWKGNKDGFLLELRGFIEQGIGISNCNRHINVKFNRVGEKEICIIKVEKSLTPIFFKKEGRKVVFIRLDNKTEPVDDPEEINEYIGDNWDE